MVTFASALSVCASPIVVRQKAGPPPTGTVGYVSAGVPGIGYSAGGLLSNGEYASDGSGVPGSTDYVVTNVPGGLLTIVLSCTSSKN